VPDQHQPNALDAELLSVLMFLRITWS